MGRPLGKKIVILSSDLVQKHWSSIATRCGLDCYEDQKENDDGLRTQCQV
jgi:hypothetical protein